MYKDEITVELRNTRNDFIETRWNQLYLLAKDSDADAVKYLFTVNAGGAVATLAYLGTISTSDITNTLTMKISLTLFFIGLILVGILKANTLTRMESLFKNYRMLVNQYYNNKITWDEVIESDEKKVGQPLLPYILGYLSFGCFILGSIVGAFTL